MRMASVQRILHLVTVTTVVAYGANAASAIFSETTDGERHETTRWNQSESDSRMFLSRDNAGEATADTDKLYPLKDLSQRKELRKIYTSAKDTLKQFLGRLLEIDDGNGTITKAGLYDVLKKFGLDSLQKAAEHLDQALTESEKNIFIIFNKPGYQEKVGKVVAWYKARLSELLALVRSILTSSEGANGETGWRFLETENLISLPTISVLGPSGENVEKMSALRRLQVLDVVHQLNPLLGITPLFGSVSEADREFLSRLDTRLRPSKDRVVRDLVFALNSRSNGVDEGGMRRLLQKVGLDRWLTLDLQHPSARLSSSELLVLQAAQKRPQIINRIQQQYERDVSRAVQNLRHQSVAVQHRSNTIAADGVLSRTYKIKSSRRLAASGLMERMNSLINPALPTRPLNSFNSVPLSPLPSLHTALNSSQLATPQLARDIDHELSAFLARERLDSIIDKPQLLQVLSQVTDGAPQLRSWTDLRLGDDMAERLASEMPFDQFLHKLKALSNDLGINAARQRLSPSLLRGRRLEDQVEALLDAAPDGTILQQVDGESDAHMPNQDSPQVQNGGEPVEKSAANDEADEPMAVEHSSRKIREKHEADNDSESEYSMIRSFFDELLLRMPDILDSDSWEDEDDDVSSEEYTDDIGGNFERLQKLAEAISVLLREYEDVLSELQLQLQDQLKMSEELGDLISEQTQEVGQQISRQPN